MRNGGQSHDPALEETPERRTADSLASAMVLACVGGLLDAFLYLDHGGVFAGAMTGNAVLCGIALLSHNGINALHHILPILGFLCGVWLAEMMQDRARHHATTVALATEATGLLVASFLPRGFPDPVYVFFIALIAAFQIASFRKVDQYSYNSTFITGDLRTFVVGVYEATRAGKRWKGIPQARDLGLIVAAFVGGAVLSALLAPRLGNRTLWIAFAAVVAVFSMALKRSVSGEAERQQRS